MTPPADRGLLARLSRISSSGRFIPEIDGLRFVAILAVVLHHLATVAVQKTGTVPQDRLYQVAMQGFFGVQLFFVISGFILSLPFAERRLDAQPGVPLGRYYGRRVTRLEPPYLINLLILFGAMVATGGWRIGELLPHLLASVFYVHAPVYGGASLINRVAWSLEVEVQFYLLAPLLATVFGMKNLVGRRALLAALIAGSALANEAFRNHAPALVTLSIAGHLHYFLLGFLLADWYLVEGRRGFSRSAGWDLLGLAAWVALVIGLVKVATPRPLLLPAILAAYVAAFRGRWTNGLLCCPLVTTIGGMCYTIYLYHLQFIEAWSRLTWGAWRPGAPFWLNYVVQAALIGVPLLAAGALLFAFFERPFMRPGWWKRA